jgi:hypothetical protein
MRRFRSTLVHALRVQALVALRDECASEAEAALQEGLTLAQEMRQPYAEGRLLHVWGALHLRHGRSAQAREQLAAAASIFQHLGARKDAERVSEALLLLR